MDSYIIIKMSKSHHNLEMKFYFLIEIQNYYYTTLECHLLFSHSEEIRLRDIQTDIRMATTICLLALPIEI